MPPSIPNKGNEAVNKPLLDNKFSEVKKDDKPLKRVSFFGLWKYASRFDIALVVVGSAVAILTGMGLPYLAIIVGSLSEAFVNATIAKNFYFIPTNTSDGWKFLGDIYTLDDFERVAYQRIWLSLYIGIALFCCATTQVYCFLTACENMMGRIRQRFFKAILKQDVTWFDNHNSGNLATKLFDDLERMREGSGDKVGLAIQYTAQFVGGFAVAFSYDWNLTLIMMSLSPLLIGCGAFLAKLMSQSAVREAQKYATAGSVAEEALSCVRTVHAFNGQKLECLRYDEALAQAKWTGVMRSVYIGIGFAVTFMVLFSSYCLAFWVGTNFVVDRGMHPEAMITVFFSVMMGSIALGQASPQLAVIGVAQGTAAAVYDVIDRKPALDSSSTEGKVMEAVDGHIKMRNVSFSYPARPDVKVLNNVSLDVKPGEVVALVGASGSGKSTICSLLLRFYDPQSGVIELDGERLSDLNVKFLRMSIGIVTQEPILFEMSIKENIQYGSDEKLKDEQIKDACRQANANKFIESLPKGYKTMVGERGVQLSGGQKQRIAIARALVRRPRILLLDESTSALDAESEYVVQEALQKASVGRTTLVIAHRLSTVRNAHRIVVMDAGTVVEEGTHDQLMEKQGVYYKLVNAQVFTDNVDVCWEKMAGRTDGARSPRNQPSPTRSVGRESLAEAVESPPRRRGRPDPVTERKRLEKELKEEDAEPQHLLRILRHARPEWALLVGGLLVCAIEGCVFPMFSVFFSNIIEVFADPNPEEKRRQGHMWALSFLVLGVIHASAMFMHALLFGLGAESLTMRLRSLLFRNLLSQEIGFFEEPTHSVGKLCTRLATDAPNVKSAVDYRLGSVLSSMVSLLFGIALAFYYNWPMAIVAVSIFPLGGVGHFFHMRYIRGRSKDDENEWENVGKTAVEAVDNIRTVQALTLEDRFYRRFCEHLERPVRSLRVRARFQAVTYGFATSIFYFLHAASFAYGVYLITERNEEPMTVLRTLFAISFTAGSMGYASAYFPEYAKARFAAGIIFKMLDRKPKIDNMSDSGRKISDFAGLIKLEDVSFVYPQRPQTYVLKGLSLQILPGRTLALVGLSGCGKSTVVSLLQRFYDTTAGRVAFDEVDVRELNIAHLRENISTVSQEPTLFDRTIRENILYGLDPTTVSESQLENVIQIANVKQFVDELPDKLDTRVGDKGTQLSGGQKQRVAIARALVRNPKVLLLDEATSALDSESERAVQSALDKATEGKTCIIVAHRLSTVVNADCIAVIQDGVVVEQGTHSELLNVHGVYAELVDKQLRSRTKTNDSDYATESD